jgi:phage regulator Rha-like protein
MKGLIPEERIERRIFVIRGQKIILDRDLAELYGVTTGNLNKAVKRNLERFPEDFMFQLNKDEENSLRFHFGSLKRGQHVKYLPYAFTEQGVAMLSSALRSKRAIQVNIAIMRAFVKLKHVLATHKELAAKFKELEQEVGRHNKLIIEIFDIIKQLTQPTAEQKRKPQIGFRPDSGWR